MRIFTLLAIYVFSCGAAFADCTPANDLVGTKSRVDWVEGGLVYDTTNDVLKTCDGTNWQTVGAGTALSGGTSGYLGVWSGPTTLGLSSTSAGQELFWDATNHRLGIGTGAPTTKLDVGGTIKGTTFDIGLVRVETLAPTDGGSGGGETTGNFTAQCQGGKLLTGGGCLGWGGVSIRRSFPENSSTWRCIFSAGDVNNKAYAICANVQ